jgi:hypothetical protein
MDNPTPAPAPTRLKGVRGEDVDAAMLWLRGTLRHLGPERCEAEVRKVPALSALLSYRAAVMRAMQGPEA